MHNRAHTILKESEREWMEGIFHNSVFQMLWAGEQEVNHTQAFLVKMGPGGFIPLHNHPGREYAYVLEGSMWAGEDLLGPGDFLTAGQGEFHEVHTDDGVTFFIVLERPIDFVEAGVDVGAGYGIAGE